ncbi:MAG TPA: TlpA disulfide reductase family protein, partial [Actinomycetota bacterium]
PVRSLWWSGVLLVGGVAIAIATTCSGSDPRVEGGVAQIDEPLPSFATVDTTVAGDPLPTDALDGEVNVINVWASWCDPCKREQPALQALHERYADEGVNFVGINYTDTLALAQRWIDDHDVTYPSIYDPDGRTAALLDFPFVPVTFLVDGTHTIRYAVYGETNEAELTGLIDELLTEAPTS